MIVVVADNFLVDLATGRAMFVDNPRTWNISITVKLKEGGLISPLAVRSWGAGE